MSYCDTLVPIGGDSTNKRRNDRDDASSTTASSKPNKAKKAKVTEVQTGTEKRDNSGPTGCSPEKKKAKVQELERGITEASSPWIL